MVSLSGGVDSMVICHICVRLATKHGADRVVAVHIDYANRPEVIFACCIVVYVHHCVFLCSL